MIRVALKGNSFGVSRFLYLSQVMWSGKLAQKRPENSPGKLQGQTLRFFVKLLYWGNDKPVSTKHLEFIKECWSPGKVAS